MVPNSQAKALEVRKNLIFSCADSWKKGGANKSQILQDALKLVKSAPEDDLGPIAAAIISKHKEFAVQFLCEAIKQQYVRFILPMLQNGIDTEHRVSYFMENWKITFLMFAICNKAFSSAEKLLEAPNIDIEQRDGNGNTALLIACEMRLLDFCKVLLLRGANINAQNTFGNTALKIAIMNDDLAMFNLLVENDADVNITDNKKNSSLILACAKKNSSMALALATNSTIDINKQNEFGSSALLLASEAGLVNVVDALCEHQELDVDLAGNSGRTPLMMACQNGHAQIAQKLLEKGANVNAIINVRMIKVSPFILAFFNGQIEIAKMLIASPTFNVNLEVAKGLSILGMSCLDGYIEIVTALLECQNIQIRKKNHLGCKELFNALKNAARNGNYAIIKKLFEFNRNNAQHELSKRKLNELQNLINEYADRDDEKIDILVEAALNIESSMLAHDEDSAGTEQTSFHIQATSETVHE
ncbi:MAG: ankyrin repeat domain-containing protein, partial [Gammaproteobacteria bacterium]